MGQLADFDLDLQFAEFARPLIERDLYASWAWEGRFVSIGSNSQGSMVLQKSAHIDAIIQTGPKTSITVEEKIVRQKYTAFAIETHGDLRVQPANGWIYSSTADKLVYAFGLPFGLEVWVMSLPELRDWFAPRELTFPLSDIPNLYRGGDEYVTRVRVVPIRAIPVDKHQYLLRWSEGSYVSHKHIFAA
jgi:hypothetical protein